MHITACDLANLLAMAKEAHTRYEERFRLDGQEPPEHTWEHWYARYIIQKLKDREYSELFGSVSCSVR